MTNNFDDAINDSFTVTLVSSASMNIFSENSLANFKNLLNGEINLQGEWKVALTEIKFPTHTNNVTETKLIYYKKDKSEQVKKLITIKFPGHINTKTTFWVQTHGITTLNPVLLLLLFIWQLCSGYFGLLLQFWCSFGLLLQLGAVCK